MKKIKNRHPIEKYVRISIFYTLKTNRFIIALNKVFILSIKDIIKLYLKFSLIIVILIFILSPLFLMTYLNNSLYMLLIPIGIYLSNELIKYEKGKKK